MEIISSLLIDRHINLLGLMQVTLGESLGFDNLNRAEHIKWEVAQYFGLKIKNFPFEERIN